MAVKAQLEAGLRALHSHLVQLRLRVLGQAGVARIVAMGAFIAAVREPSEPSIKPFRKPVCNMGRWRRGGRVSFSVHRVGL